MKTEYNKHLCLLEDQVLQKATALAVKAHLM